MITRRSFMYGAASSALAFGLKKLKDVGLQLYTVRGELRKDFEGTIAKIAALGYSELEFAGYYNRPPMEIRSLLERYRLKSPATHIPLADLRKDISKVIDSAKTIGHHYVICPWLEPQDRRSLDIYRGHAKLFNEFGAACKKAGLQFGYHNHDFEFADMGGQMPFDLLLKETDPQLVKMELDLYWVTRAGQDALKYLENNPGRVELVHVKDMASTPDRAAVEVGRGTIDFKAIFARAERSGVKHFFVEQDEPKTPLESIKISIDYLRRFEY